MMWRYLAGGAATLLMVGAGMLLFGGSAKTTSLLPERPASLAAVQGAEPLPDSAPEATPATREQKRFNRYDKDRDGKVTREEYLMQRRKAYAKLDTNHDGQLSFDEWAIKATTKFAAADADKTGAMSATEFATTAVKRKAPSRAKCPPPSSSREEES